MYILTLNFPNQTSIIGFHSRFLKTWPQWNKDTSINYFITDVIVQTTFTFINLKFHSFIKLNIKNLSIIVFFFIVYRWKTNLRVVIGLPVSNIIPSIYIILITPSTSRLTLNEPVSRVGDYAWGDWSW
jgi:hypothetical protein